MMYYIKNCILFFLTFYIIISYKSLFTFYIKN